MGVALQDILERKETLLIPNDMNNKEKAINIGENNLDRCFGSKIDYGVTCALEMAKWKEQKVIEYLYKNIQSLLNDYGVSEASADLATKLFLANFKQAMEENS